MRAAATHLGLPAGQAPMVEEFKRAARETDLPMTFGVAHAAFEKRWGDAQRFFRGEHVPETAAQRRTRREAKAMRSPESEHPLTGLRRFLAQEPPPASTTRDDYERWAREMNANLPRGWGRIAQNSNNLCRVLGTSWEGALRVARGETRLEHEQQESLAAKLAATGPLVGTDLAARMLGVNRNDLVKLPDHPQPVAVLGSKPLWLRSEIEAYKAGKRVFRHERGSQQGDWVDTSGLAERLGVAQRSVARWVENSRWHKVPRPAGMTADRRYWRRREVDQWLRERAESTAEASVSS
jgi:predicted DNA-binding transcriptional regulator AlpA